MTVIHAALTLTLLGMVPVAAVSITPEGAADLITNLPGVPVGFTNKMYAGYIDVSRSGEAVTRSMFYWFVESDRSPQSDPVLLWTNGGPGCSGLSGFMTEQGPFRPTAEGNLTTNPFAWNKLANVVFIEQPVGVGFSRVDGGEILYGDAPSAEDNYKFIQGFHARYPDFATNDLYITSESYGGHYMPTLAREIIVRGDIPSFKGVAVGNPLTWMPYRDYGQYGTAYGHQLLPKPLWDEYTLADCMTTFPASDACNKITDKMDKILAGFDAYALDFPTCLDHTRGAGRHERWSLVNMLRKAKKAVGGYFPDKYDPCRDDWAAAYLNRPDVQAAIHARPHGTWSACSDDVGSKFNQTDTIQPMMPVWKEVVARMPSIRIMIYSGDDDSVCATLGTQQFIWDMGWTLAGGDADSWQPWKTNGGQVAGFRTKFKEASFVTVHGAGHMVPATRPEQCLTMLDNFLNGTW